MRLLSGVLLIVALLAGLLWMFSSALSGVAGIVAFLFLILFLISLFLKRRHPEEL